MHLRGRARLIAGVGAGFAAFLVSGFFIAPGPGHLPVRFALAWDIGIVTYLLRCLGMMLRSGTEHIERRAGRIDVSLGEIVLLAVLAAGFSLFAAVRVISIADGASHFSLATGAVTVTLSWWFVHTLFAIHYAHEYHAESAGKRRGLDFNEKAGGNPEPDYWDFVYFAVTIGMTCQTADVSIQSRPMRHIVTAHGIISFFFNTVIVVIAVAVVQGRL